MRTLWNYERCEFCLTMKLGGREGEREAKERQRRKEEREGGMEGWREGGGGRDGKTTTMKQISKIILTRIITKTF